MSDFRPESGQCPKSGVGRGAVLALCVRMIAAHSPIRTGPPARLETKVDGLETKVDGLETKVDGLDVRAEPPKPRRSQPTVW